MELFVQIKLVNTYRLFIIIPDTYYAQKLAMIRSL